MTALLFYFFMTLPLGARVIKVLAIGNSFSEDAVEHYLYELAAAQGDSLVIGNAYIGGCSIERHYYNLQNHKKEYAYRKIVGGERTEERDVELSRIVLDEPWDVITLQQASQLSGIPESYANLPALLQAVKRLASNAQVQMAWHMTWAYAEDFKDQRFEAYYYDQHIMYSAILTTMQAELARSHITLVIPSGTAIQLARYQMGNVMNRDGFHLSYTLGRYTAACTWCEFLTGRIVDGNAYYPESLTFEEASLCQQAAHEAMFMQQQHRNVPF